MRSIFWGRRVMLLVWVEARRHHPVRRVAVALRWVARMTAHWMLTIGHHGVRGYGWRSWRCAHRAAVRTGTSLCALEVVRSRREWVGRLWTETIWTTGIVAVEALSD